MENEKSRKRRGNLPLVMDIKMEIKKISNLNYESRIREILDKEENAISLSFWLGIRLANYNNYHSNTKLSNIYLTKR